MKKHKDSKVTKLVDKAMRLTEVEKPSADFTTLVMNKIEKVPVVKTTAYKPLISKWVWIFIGLLILTVYSYLAMHATPSYLFTLINFNFIFDNKIMQLYSEVNPPLITNYALIFLSFMLLIQIPILKWYFEKRISL